LSAIYDVAHGAGLAAITPSWMRYVYAENIPLFLQFAVNVMGVPEGFRDPESAIEEGISRLQAFYKRLGLPTTLTELGIREDDFETMAEKATGLAYGSPEMPIGSLKKLYRKDIVNIYELAK
jgi:alcohol dehydrogenase YqhD (iron-dependent ADH family)